MLSAAQNQEDSLRFSVPEQPEKITAEMLNAYRNQTKEFIVPLPVKTLEQMRVPFDLKKYEKNFNELLAMLQEIKEVLEVKKNNSSEKYSTVFDKALSLQDTLSQEEKQFFTSPTPEGFTLFKTNCHNAINDAESEFKKHRGIWYKLHPVIKGILGFLAALTVIPGLVVAATSRQDYSKTFFSTPETNSQQKLTPIKEELKQQEEDMDQTFGLCFATC